MKQYCMIRMDLMNSRTIKNRSEIQECLYDFLNDLNKEYESILVAPIAIVLGDEWSILLRDGHYAYEIYLKIKRFLKDYELEVYTGIAYGTIKSEESDIRLIEGEALDLAAYNLRIAKSSKFGYQKQIPTKACHILVSGLHSTFYGVDCNELVNDLIQNNEILLSKVTKTQQAMIQLYEKYGSYNQILKHHIDITKRMISDGLNKSEYWLICENVRQIEALLAMNYS